jgi:ketosteroid isomerase-like protein
MTIESDLSSTIIAMERAALDRWGHGDPGGFLEICAPDVVYFDPYHELRVDGIEALTQLYRTLWGQVHIDRFELLNPVVQISGEAAVLTFNYVSYEGGEESRWNCTEVYRHDQGRWRIIQTHWSYTLHGLKK